MRVGDRIDGKADGQSVIQRLSGFKVVALVNEKNVGGRVGIKFNRAFDDGFVLAQRVDGRMTALKMSLPEFGQKTTDVDNRLPVAQTVVEAAQQFEIGAAPSQGLVLLLQSHIQFPQFRVGVAQRLVIELVGVEFIETQKQRAFGNLLTQRPGHLLNSFDGAVEFRGDSGGRVRQIVVARVPNALFPSQDVGQVDGLDDGAVLDGLRQRRHILLVQPDGFLNRVGQCPLFGQPFADDGMVDAQDALFHLGDVAHRRFGELHHAGKAFGQTRCQGHFAHVVQQTTDEGFVGVDGAVDVRHEHAGGAANGQAVYPEPFTVEGVGLVVLGPAQRLEDFDAKDGISDGVEAQ